MFTQSDWLDLVVSTHSRPKAAGLPLLLKSPLLYVSTHSRPKAAGFVSRLCIILSMCFNTQPPEGGWKIALNMAHEDYVSTHSRPKAAGFDVRLYL